MNLRRFYAVNQIEYCRNFIFKRHFPIHRIFERSCEIGLWRLTADKISGDLRQPRQPRSCEANSTPPWSRSSTGIISSAPTSNTPSSSSTKVRHLPAQ